MTDTDITGRSVTRTAGTEVQYVRRMEQFRRQAVQAGYAATLPDCVTWFTCNHDQWSESTVRNYGAALQHAVRTAHAVGQIGLGQTEQLFSMLAIGPLPRTCGPKRTSAKKRKSMPEEEFATLIAALETHGTADARLVARLLTFNVILFMRPIEFIGARVVGNELVICSAKTTNGRGLGPERHRELTNLSHRQRRGLEALLNDLRKAANQAGGADILFPRLAALLARKCKSAGIKRISLYTTRHIGIATAKRHLSPEEVAAAAGHRTTRTATSHYAKRRTGWKKPILILNATPETIRRVDRSPKASREKNMQHRKETKANAPYRP